MAKQKALLTAMWKVPCSAPARVNGLGSETAVRRNEYVKREESGVSELCF